MQPKLSKYYSFLGFTLLSLEIKNKGQNCHFWTLSKQIKNYLFFSLHRTIFFIDLTHYPLKKGIDI